MTEAQDSRVSATRVRELTDQARQVVYRRADRVFAGLLAVEWLAAVGLALWISPRAWEGELSRTHPHVWAAVVLGFAVVSLPIALTTLRPGRAATRHAVAAGQLMMSALLIHLTGGRPETHFHVFGSLAFLAFYRDWRVVLTGSAVTAVDHAARGLLWPESVFGTAAGADWRWVEHAGWVGFIDLFLVYSCVQGDRDLAAAAARQAELEATQADVAGQVRDRTRELHDSEQRFRGALDSAAIGMALVSLDGHWLRVNASLCRIIGYDEAELLAMTFQDITDPADLAADLAQVGRLIAGEIPDYHMEKRYVHKSGRTVWAMLSVSLVRDPAGAPAYFVSQIQDIGDRRRAEEEARASAAEAEAQGNKLLLLLESTGEGIYGIDLQGCCTFVNPAGAKLLGYSPREMLGRNAHELIHHHRADGTPYPVAACPINLSFRVGENCRVADEVLWRRDGTPFDAEYTARPIVELGAILGAVVTFSDISGRRRDERELVAAVAAAEEASRAKSEFLANMSHEVRTPLNGILGLTELVLGGGLTRDQRESLGMVQSSAESLMAVINDILDFSKIEAGKLDLDPTPFCLADAVGDTLKLLALRAHVKGLELVGDVRPGVPEVVVGDAGRLRQVLTNLVGNAVKFTESGEVVVRVERVADAAAGHCVRFGVRDTGVGIPKSQQASVFEAFTQADGSTTRRFGGTGLGLTISSRLVALMGGRIWVESEPGRGSTFSFEVALGRATGSSIRPLPQPAADLRGVAVLVVDDNATNRRVLEETLRLWGAVPACAQSGPEALAELRRAAAAGTPYPLILLDVMMPDMDGFTVAGTIAGEPALAGASILMLTSADRQEDAARSRAVGVGAYLVKPVKAAELLRSISSVLQLAAGLAPPLSGRMAAPVTTSEAAPAARRMRILLAEDNPVNQRVAVRLLEKLGHSVTVANHGGEALAELGRAAFDLVLMDVQMPEVDGFAATAEIRRREEGTGRRAPVVAMTAHAMKGDRERCLAAGMDDYLSKPVLRGELVRVLEWAAAAGDDPAGPRDASAVAAQTPAPASLPASLPPALDRAAALDRLDGDEELWAEVAAMFREDAPRLLGEVRAAVAAGDAGAVQRSAHGLKGAAGYVGAGPAAAAAHHLEQLGASGNLSQAGVALRHLEREVSRLLAALAADSAGPVADAPGHAGLTSTCS